MPKHQKAISLAVATSFLINPSVHALVDDESTFVSLTRQPTSVSKLPTNISILDSDQIARSGAKTLSEVLDILPGIDVQRSGEIGTLSSIRMRGVPTSNQVQIIIDDQPVGGVSIQEINIGLIPVDNIERIEVVRGSSPILYGANTIGGVVHIITKKKLDTPEVTLGFEGRSYATKINTAKAGGQAGALNYFVTGSHYETDGYLHNSEGKDTTVTNSFGYDFGGGANVGLDAEFTKHDLGSPNGTSVPFDRWNRDRERVPNSLTQNVQNELNRVRLKGVAPLGGSAQLQSMAYTSNESYKLRLSRAADPLATFDNKVVGNDTRLSFVNGFVFGGSYERDERESLGQLPRHTTNWGLYAQHEINANKLSLLPALRFDQHGSFGNQLNPRLAIVYRLMDAWKVSASAARSFRAPTLADLYIVATDPFFPAFDFFGNPNLKPETAWTYDVGSEVRPSENTRVSLTGYFTRIRERITTVDTDGNGNNDTYRNLSRAELTGLELEIGAKTGFFSHELNGTVQQAKGTSATGAKYERLRLTPRYLANYRLTATAPTRTRFINTLQFVDHQFQNDGNRGIKLPDYLLWHVRLEQQIKGLTMFAGVNNLSDKIYAESFTFGNPTPQAPRTYVAGASMTFR